MPLKKRSPVQSVLRVLNGIFTCYFKLVFLFIVYYIWALDPHGCRHLHNNNLNITLNCPGLICMSGHFFVYIKRYHDVFAQCQIMVIPLHYSGATWFDRSRIDCLCNSLSMLTATKTSKLRIIRPLWGESTSDRWKIANKAETVSMSWRYDNDIVKCPSEIYLCFQRSDQNIKAHFYLHHHDSVYEIFFNSELVLLCLFK